MRMNYRVTGSERKELVKAIESITSEKAKYMGMPSAAFQIGAIMVSKTGEVEGNFGEDLIEELSEMGFEGEGEIVTEKTGDIQEEEDCTNECLEVEETESGTAESAEPESVNLTVTLPLTGHTENTLMNLVNLVFTRSKLLNKALGTGFWVNEALIDALSAKADMESVDDFAKAVESFEAENGKAICGLSITPVNITFSGLPETTDTDKIHTFTVLAAMMNKQALTQKRIQAKEVNDANEKYALRIWLTRLGMIGDEYKADRRILMENLSGHSAFRTEADKERWMKRQAEKKAALKEAETAIEEVAG